MGTGSKEHDFVGTPSTSCLTVFYSTCSKLEKNPEEDEGRKQFADGAKVLWLLWTVPAASNSKQMLDIFILKKTPSSLARVNRLQCSGKGDSFTWVGNCSKCSCRGMAWRIRVHPYFKDSNFFQERRRWDWRDSSPATWFSKILAGLRVYRQVSGDPEERACGHWLSCLVVQNVPSKELLLIHSYCLLGESPSQPLMHLLLVEI